MKLLIPAFSLLMSFSVSYCEAAESPVEPIPLLIVDGQNNHDWATQTKILKEILEPSGLFRVDVTTTPPAKAPAEAWANWRPDFSRYKVVLSNFNGGHTTTGTRWPRNVEKALERLCCRGWRSGGLPCGQQFVSELARLQRDDRPGLRATSPSAPD